MLQLLPALVLLMLQGPAALHRGALADRTPDAIRAIVEWRQPDDEADADSQLESAERLCELLKSHASPVELSAAIACFLGLDTPTQSDSRSLEVPSNEASTSFDDPPARQTDSLGSRCHPCRAGPTFVAA